MIPPAIMSDRQRSSARTARSSLPSLQLLLDFLFSVQFGLPIYISGPRAIVIQAVLQELHGPIVDLYLYWKGVRVFPLDLRHECLAVDNQFLYKMELTATESLVI